MEAEKQWEIDGETQRNDKAKDPKEQNPILNTSNKLCRIKKKKKKGRPEKENFSQETGLPDYLTGLTGVHTTDRVEKANFV